MKKKLSGFGIFVMLILKNPPMPEFAIFQNVTITEVRTLSRKKLALEFQMN